MKDVIPTINMWDYIEQNQRPMLAMLMAHEMYASLRWSEKLYILWSGKIPSARLEEEKSIAFTRLKPLIDQRARDICLNGRLKGGVE
jgi:hypothetical protein